MQELVI